MERAGIETVVLQARDGLSMINGSNFILGMGALILHDAERWLKQAEIACAMTLEALYANRVRSYKGNVTLNHMLDPTTMSPGWMSSFIEPTAEILRICSAPAIFSASTFAR